MKPWLAAALLATIPLALAAPAAAASDPRVVRATVKVEKNRLTAFVAAARARAVKLCDDHPGSERAKITVVAKTGIGYVYGYSCAEVLRDPVGPTIPETTIPATTMPTVPPTVAVTAAPPAAAVTYFANCTDAKAAGAAPLHAGDPGYRTALDRDGDGVACET